MPAASGMQKVTNVPNHMHKIESTLIKSIEKEVKDLSSSERSPFRVSSVDDVKKFSFSKQKEEVIENAPLLWKLLNAAAVNRRAQNRNTVKTEESIEPAILTAIGILLHCHSTCMNMNATINSIILRRGGADKLTFKRFSHISLCLSYPSALKLQSELGKEN
jgi:hypothetical protein